ncbi:MAG: hypothetical protein KDK25_05750 [Leptospiraceae bacterium]|nr:hypothetical protein [Leptospiraceae bacterium]
MKTRRTQDKSPEQSGHLSRRTFLQTTGGFLTAAALSQYCSSGHGRYPDGSADPVQSARAAGLETPILQTLNAAISAPNPHNTQAWKFRLLSETEALLYVDESRILPQTDPTTRQIHMGQGCLLEVAAISAGHTGHEAKIQLFPEGYKARDAGKKPIASIALMPSEKKDPLFAEVARRHTVRSAYSGPLITEAEFLAVQDIVVPKVCQLRFTPPAELKKHLAFHMEGFETEMQDFPAAEESRQWFRIGNEEIYSRRDGISLAGNGVTGFQKWFIETFFLSHDPEDYYDPDGQKMFLDRYRENLFTARGQVLFITRSNTVRDWVLCGRDYARFQLAARSLGLVMRPTSQLMQEFESMQPIAKRYNEFVGIKAPAKIQINALIGRAEVDFLSPRRPLRDMIES